MSEINDQPVEVGDVILVNTQVATITAYDEGADRMTYVLGEGNGTNFISGHISNTKFRKIDLNESVGLAHQQHAELVEAVSEVKTITDPQEEDPDTDRVKGPQGAKIPGGNGTPGRQEDEQGEGSGDELIKAS